VVGFLPHHPVDDVRIWTDQDAEPAGFDAINYDLRRCGHSTVSWRLRHIVQDAVDAHSR
jgi:hypothetical protein